MISAGLTWFVQGFKRATTWAEEEAEQEVDRRDSVGSDLESKPRKKGKKKTLTTKSKKSGPKK